MRRNFAGIRQILAACLPEKQLPGVQREQGRNDSHRDARGRMQMSPSSRSKETPMNRFAWCVSTSALMLAALGGTTVAGEPHHARPAPYYRLPCYGPPCVVVVYVPVR